MKDVMGWLIAIGAMEKPKRAETVAAFRDYERAMAEEAIPQMIRDIAERHALAAEARRRVLKPGGN